MKTNSAYTYKGLKTEKNFQDEERSLIEKIESSSEKASDYNLELAWLYDQWALRHAEVERVKYQQKAEHYFKQALKKGAKDWLVFNGLGTVELHRQNFEKALEYYNNVHALNESALSYNALGNVYRQLKEYGKAKQYYQKSYKIADNDVERTAAQYNLDQLK